MFNASTKPSALTSFFFSVSAVGAVTLPSVTVSVVVSATIFWLSSFKPLPILATTFPPSTFKPSPVVTSYLTLMLPLSLLTVAVVALPFLKFTLVPDVTVSAVPAFTAVAPFSAVVPSPLTLQPLLFTASITAFAVTKPVPSSASSVVLGVPVTAPFLPVTNLPSFSLITEVFGVNFTSVVLPFSLAVNTTSSVFLSPVINSTLS